MRKIFSVLFALVMVVSLTLVTAVPAVAADTLNVPSGSYPTIQAAITAANPGDTILVAAGTYIENVVIPVGKNDLQLLGAGSGVTSIAPASGRAVELQGNLGYINGITIKGFTLVTVSDAVLAFIAVSGSNPPYTITNLVLDDIVVTGRVALYSVQGATLTNVHISNIDGTKAALWMQGACDITFTGGSIGGIGGAGIGVRLSSDFPSLYGPNGNIQIHNSNLAGTAFAVENLDSGTVINAESNWWGTATGPSHPSNIGGTGGSVSNNVDFSPWLSAEWIGGTEVGLTGDVPSIIAISVSPAAIDFGTVYPGQLSALTQIKVSNIGTVIVKVTASLAPPPGTVFENLKLAGTAPPSAWAGISNLLSGSFQNVGAQLEVPSGYIPKGTETATLIFEVSTP